MQQPHKNPIKDVVYDIMEPRNSGSLLGRLFDIFILALVVINMIIIVAETFTLPPIAATIFAWIEWFSVIVFTIEYILRVWTANRLRRDLTRTGSRAKYIFSPMALIDLLSILPFYLTLLLPIDLSILRILRVARLFRVFKLVRYTSAMSAIANVFRRKKTQLLSSIFVVALLMVIAAVLMYHIENAAQPNVFQNAFSALWWAVATLTTVGYGDIYPVTMMGKILSACIALLGIGLVAVPTGIISAGFMETMDKSKDCDKESNEDSGHYCPHCGKKIK